jgi:hypothetical protein
MTTNERQARDLLRNFGRTLIEKANDPDWSVRDLLRHVRTQLRLAHAHTKPEKREAAK